MVSARGCRCARFRELDKTRSSPFARILPLLARAFRRRTVPREESAALVTNKAASVSAASRLEGVYVEVGLGQSAEAAREARQKRVPEETPALGKTVQVTHSGHRKCFAFLFN